MSNFLKAAGAAGLIVSIATLSCGGDVNPGTRSPTVVTLAPAPGGDRVLFIGNSLTEGNDLPLMVEALALYMVWPESGRPQAFPDVSASYRLAAEDVEGILLPAGDAWVAAWREDQDLRLYGPDGFHPTVLGSYLAALTIYGGLTGASPVGLPPLLQLRNGRRIEVTAREAAIAQAAALESLQR